ncbi:hypothetical protein [Vibrio zhugei]|nr:hypothetical protein [Vibrio zhugei]
MTFYKQNACMAYEPVSILVMDGSACGSLHCARQPWKRAIILMAKPKLP